MACALLFWIRQFLPFYAYESYFFAAHLHIYTGGLGRAFVALAPGRVSTELKDKPLSARLLDEEVVIFRTSKGVLAAKDMCLHRGAKLSLGWVEGDEIVCGYHGFRYNGEGACTKIPAHPDLPISKKLCLTTYRAVERYGLIWVCMTGVPTRELPHWPEMEDATYHKLQIQPIDWKTSASRMIENFFDVSHFSWIHTQTFGNRAKPEIDKYEVSRSPAGLHMEYTYPTQGRFGDCDTTFIYDVCTPFSVRLLTQRATTQSNYLIFVSTCPISSKCTRIFSFIAMDAPFESPQEVIDWEKQVFAEDQAMAESQRPEELPLDLSEEFHIRADQMSTAYRKELFSLGLGRNYTA